VLRLPSRQLSERVSSEQLLDVLAVLAVPTRRLLPT